MIDNIFSFLFGDDDNLQKPRGTVNKIRPSILDLFFEHVLQKKHVQMNFDHKSVRTTNFEQIADRANGF